MRVLGASEGRIFWEVVVRGTLDKALDTLRQNLAMGWAMITMVEGISRAEGGVGALILNQNKHFHLPRSMPCSSLSWCSDCCSTTSWLCPFGSCVRMSSCKG
jgi:ABC-type nitrate/sulfonate/bicarbonate transport system permease component